MKLITLIYFILFTVWLSSPVVAIERSDFYDKASAAYQQGNLTKGAYWFKKAAYQGSALAQIKLGVMYLNGEGVNKSNSEAFIWFYVAAVNDKKDSIENRDQVATTLSPIELESARKKAQMLYNRIYN